MKTTETMELIIDYDKTIEQIISEGSYDWSNRDITSKNFPIPPEMIGEKINESAELFYFGIGVESEYVIKEMDNNGYRPATLIELLFFGILFPWLQKRFTIVALGSFWFNSPYYWIPYLSSDEEKKKRWIRLSRSNHIGPCTWFNDCRFLGIKKV